MTFREFLDGVLLPMFPGVEVTDDEWQPQRQLQSLVSFAPGANRIRLRENAGDSAFLQLSRAQPFATVEKDFIESLVRAFVAVKAEAETFLPQLKDEII